ncbi:hypothetical protein N7492_007331 [Penicillium capsulatum]|uniref:Uncharacterized protein n=1 Tax=Penicillium capsulatum TaxID=69766 RepID=A0A9W9HZK0_9EURO|nr:hypothetical protein N7492_007331 [Penicillium capsulatum]KAJ6117171.1 hypothetical protein N7512_006896 [Penicillium capsulatum]
MRRSSTNSPSPVGSTSRAMEDDMPEPLTAWKYRVVKSQPLISPGLFLQIPRRKPSLSASVSTSSNDLATSTRTPSLSDSLYQLEVAKTRQPVISNDLEEDPFVDQVFLSTPRLLADTQNNNCIAKYGPAPQLVFRWSSGSWVSPQAGSSNSSLSLGPSRAVVESGQFSVPPISQGSFNSLCPIELPVTFVNVRSAASPVQIGMDSGSLWTAVHVSADISPMSLPGASALAPLDIVLLLDSLPQPSVNLLTQVTLSSSVLASHLTPKYDRLALAYVDGSAKDGFRVLLSLECHDLKVVRSALDKFSRRQLMKDSRPRSELVDAIQRLSGIFDLSPRSAFCHLFFVSATPPVHLSLPRINPAIGFHTITPQSCFPLSINNAALHPGWHISYAVGECDVGFKETHFIRKVSRVIRQLRTGIHPGALLDLKLSIIPANGCQTNPPTGVDQLISLRPGETWSVPVQVDVPVASRQTSPMRGYRSKYPPIICDLMAQIDHLAQEFAPDEVTQPILTACVDYQHSLLPEFNRIQVNRDLTVMRMTSATLRSMAGIGGTCSSTLNDGSPSKCF